MSSRPLHDVPRAGRAGTGEDGPPPSMAGVVDRNIAALLERRRADEQRQSPSDQLAAAVTRFTGSMRFVWVHLLVFGIWIVWNLGGLGLHRFDPSFVGLAMVASVEAIFLSTFVLISQNRMTAQANSRADLDLQISLLTEHEVTRLITMTSAIARRLQLPEAEEPEIAELEQDVHPEEVLEVIERHDNDGAPGEP